jgi:hypothetical protein
MKGPAVGRITLKTASKNTTRQKSNTNTEPGKNFHEQKKRREQIAFSLRGLFQAAGDA